MPEAQANKPSHYIYFIETWGAKGAEKKRWIKIGAAWPNEDGKGYNQHFTLFPVGAGRVTMREAHEVHGESEDESDAKPKAKAA